MKKLIPALVFLLSAISSKAQIHYVEPFGGISFGRPIVVGDFYDMDLSRSHDFCLDLLRCGFPVWGNENIRFRIQGRWEFFSLGNKYYKMKFHYAGVPIGITFRKNLFKVGFQWTTQRKIFAREKDFRGDKTIVEKLEGVNPLRMTGELSFSYAFFGIYGRVSATPIFRRGYHPGCDDARLVTFGIVIDL